MSSLAEEYPVDNGVKLVFEGRTDWFLAIYVYTVAKSAEKHGGI